MAQFKNENEVLRAKNKIYLTAIGVVVVMNLVLIIAVVKLSMSRTLGIDIPPIAYNIHAGDKAYMTWWGKNFIYKVSEYTPQTYEDKVKELLIFASSRAKDTIREQSRDDSDLIKKNNRTQSFHPYEGTWIAQQKTDYLWRVSVKGQVDIRQGGIMRNFDGTYWVDLIYRDRIYLEGFGNDFTDKR